MRQYIILFILVLFSCTVNGQHSYSLLEGRVSYKSSKNTYVKFESTKAIDTGDTLFVLQDSKLKPALQVINLSSISCVCKPISDLVLNTDDKIYAKRKPDNVNKSSVIRHDTLEDVRHEVYIKADTSKKVNNVIEQEIHGGLSISSHSTISNTSSGEVQRMRYKLDFRVENIANSKFSAELYTSFAHSNKNWDEVKSNILNGLKIYNLSVYYKPDNSLIMSLGRNINRSISSLGAIDGLQIEKKINWFVIGGLIGSRPDYVDYGLNLKLLQYGVYFGQASAKNGKQLRSTLAFIEQKNSGNTDRRFAYLQHTNSLISNLYFFGSAEIELYKNINNIKTSKPDLTNLYLLLRYRVHRKLSLSVSYNARNNIIYYETYKEYVERLIERSTVNGYKFHVHYRPLNWLSLGLRIGYRARKEDPEPSKNIQLYAAVSKVPGINSSLQVTATLLETSYLKGNIYSIGIMKNIIPKKISGSIRYRYVDYSFLDFESNLVQNIAEASLNWRIIKKLIFSLSYEGIYEKTNSYNMIYLNLNKRF